ncbi:hypothetical protein QOZ80_6AG0523320 [Eleusine coracana subsp. coracana]|nr:hypothetical protein QOZ80_6AG0523320 [Eleusine coracana subsp. coracana]
MALLQSLQVVFAMGLVMPVLPRGVAGGKFPAVIVFGDSTADTGNNNFIQTLFRGNYPPYGRDYAGGIATGRFSNGRLAADFVSEALGLAPAVPAYLEPGRSIHRLASGVSFASAGSGLDDVTAQILSAVSLRQQIQHFKEYKARLRHAKGDAAANHIITRSLYIFSVGASDFLGNYLLYPIRRRRFTLPEYEAFLVGAAEAAVRDVHGLGARRVRIVGLPPLGCLPLLRTVNRVRPGECSGGHNVVAVRFNRRLRALVWKLNLELPGAQVAYVDQYRLLADMIDKPWKYGFENSVRGCCGTGYVETGVLCSLDNALTCDRANKYVFFDVVHPSERAYEMVAKEILNGAPHLLK